MTPISVSITTRNRPAMLLQLLRDIEECMDDFAVQVFVYDDYSSANYRYVADYVGSMGGEFLRFPRHHGKQGYWQIVSKAFNRLRHTDARYHFFLQDDLRLCSDFFSRAVSLWGALPDQPPRGALNLLRDDGDAVRWVDSTPERCGRVDRVGWTDCAAVLLTEQLLRTLDWSVPPPTDCNWEWPTQDSGVGRTISVRAGESGLSVYRVVQSLVVHLAAPSEMHPDERTVHPLRTVNYVDGDAAARGLESASLIRRPWARPARRARL